jgi:hypothetical protein
MIITASDLTTNIYQEKLDAITRTDSTIITSAISTAVNEAQSYLSRFNLLQLFGDDNASPPVAPAITDEFLNMLCKDIACWHLAKLANVGIDITLLRTSYEDAVSTLLRIQQVKQTPNGWPLLDLTTITTTPGNPVEVNARHKRRNNY